MAAIKFSEEYLVGNQLNNKLKDDLPFDANKVISLIRNYDETKSIMVGDEIVRRLKTFTSPKPALFQQYAPLKDVIDKNIIELKRRYKNSFIECMCFVFFFVLFYILYFVFY